MKYRKNCPWYIVVTAIIFFSSLVTDVHDVVAETPTPTASPEIRLRSEPTILAPNEIIYLFKEKGLYGLNVNPDGNFPNIFELHILNGDKVIVDQATSLMWQQSGSENSMTYNEAQEYIEILNQQQFAGYTDWRLPTIEELGSLLEPQLSNGFFINPIFDEKQILCWSADVEGRSKSGMWGIDFSYPYVLWYIYPDSNPYVRAVRSYRSSKLSTTNTSDDF